MRSYFYLTVLVCLIAAQSLLGQKVVIGGKVLHANTHEAISGVNIYIKDTTKGTTSYLDGTFKLSIPNPSPQMLIMFDHISFYPLEIELDKAQSSDKFYLKPQVIQFPDISVTGEKQPPVLLKDIPQTYTVIEAKTFDGRGYKDIGDILKAEQSVQVEEQVSGIKTIALRGGNPDDVIVLYDGVKVNSISNNVFDFSQVNLEDVRQIEIVRGGNTALYGAGAISGIINIVPKTFRDYSIKLQQRKGSYNTTDWNLQLHRNLLKRLDLSYTYKRGNIKRKFLDETGFEHHVLKNTSSYHTASMTYNFADDRNEESDHNLRIFYFRSKLDYQNQKFRQNISDFNQITSMRYVGKIWKINNLNLTSSFQWLDTEQLTSNETDPLDRHFDNRNFLLNFEKRFILNRFEFTTAYQFENGDLDYQDNTITDLNPGIRSALLTRQKHGLVGVLKLHLPTKSTFLQATDFNLSFRHESVKNRKKKLVQNTIGAADNEEKNNLGEGDWKEGMFNLSSSLVGKNERIGINAHANFGKNFKFPTMLQQIGNPFTIDTFFKTYQPNLNPEWSNHLEVSFDFFADISKELTLNGCQLGMSVFTTRYTNKIRILTPLFSPITVYDNVAEAAISGFESKLKLFALQKKLTFELLTSFYSISDKNAFPYKSNNKIIFNTLVEHHGTSFQFTWFWESEKLAWIRGEKDALFEQILPSKGNMDIHISKRFEIWKLKFLANISGLNILGDSLEIDGFSLRDSKFYLTLGMQY